MQKCWDSSAAHRLPEGSLTAGAELKHLCCVPRWPPHAQGSGEHTVERGEQPSGQFGSGRASRLLPGLINPPGTELHFTGGTRFPKHLVVRDHQPFLLLAWLPHLLPNAKRMSIIAHTSPVLIRVRKGTAGERPPDSRDWSGLPLPDNSCLGVAAGSCSWILQQHNLLLPTRGYFFCSQPLDCLIAATQHRLSPEDEEKSGSWCWCNCLHPSTFILAPCNGLLQGGLEEAQLHSKPHSAPPRTDDFSLSFCLLPQQHLQLRSHLPPPPPEGL